MSSVEGDSFIVRLGGVTSILAALIFFANFFVMSFGGGGLFSGDPLEVVNAYKGSAAVLRILGSVLFSTVFIIMIPTALALLTVLKGPVRGYSLLACVFSIIGMLTVVLVQGGVSVFVFPQLASEFFKATAQMKDQILLMVRMTLSFLIVGVFFSDLFISLGVGLFSVSMLRSGLFSRKLCWLGEAIGVLGLLGTFTLGALFTLGLTPQNIPIILLPLLVAVVLPVFMLVPWVIATGLRLLKLAGTRY